MVEKAKLITNFEGFVQMLLNRLDIPTKKNINSLHDRLDKLEQVLYQKHPTAKKKKAKPAVGRKSASSVVLDVIANHPEGTNFKTIKAATGFNDKKLRNIIFRLDKIKKIKRIKRGIYKKT